MDFSSANHLDIFQEMRLGCSFRRQCVSEDLIRSFGSRAEVVGEVSNHAPSFDLIDLEIRLGWKLGNHLI